MYGPLTLIIFLLGYCMFRLCFHRPISIIFRLYSFFWYLSELLFLVNIEKLTFLAAQNFKTLFSLTPGFRWVQVAFVLFVFMVLLQVVCLFFVYRIKYKKLYKYFLSNMYRVKGSFQLTFILYVFKPTFCGAIHALIYEDTTKQLALLGTTELLSFVLISVFQMKF